MNNYQENINAKATKTTWNEIKNTHIDNIKRYLQFVVDKPELYLKNNNNIEEKQYLSNRFI